MHIFNLYNLFEKVCLNNLDTFPVNIQKQLINNCVTLVQIIYHIHN